uniref:Uncharacterized protein n=1 Tax=Timema bartmani TaxID=61472 RepID=A0A7R9F192_9NEOP|nr:unnamed protein product [Timema bartmani]
MAGRSGALIPIGDCNNAELGGIHLWKQQKEKQDRIRRCEHACMRVMRMPAACPGCEGRGGWTRDPTGRELEPLQGLRGVWAARESVISDFLLYLTGHQGIDTSYH